MNWCKHLYRVLESGTVDMMVTMYYAEGVVQMKHAAANALAVQKYLTLATL